MTAPEQVKVVGDVISVSTVVATLAGWLPYVAALFTVLWTMMRMHEMITGKPFSHSLMARAIVRAMHCVGSWFKKP